MNRFILSLALVCTVWLQSCLQSDVQSQQPVTPAPSFFINSTGDTIHTVKKAREQWKADLAADAYYVLREKGTERPFTGKYNENKKQGVYACQGCGLPLFSSRSKFDSGTGWPSFYAPIDQTHVEEITDRSHGMTRVEVVCHRCGGHLGHVFDDGPPPTGLRYCMNSVSLDFKED